MYCSYGNRQELEDELYRRDEGDSEGSEDGSELEFHLYSQLHYSANAGETEEDEDGRQLEGTETTPDDGRGPLEQRGEIASSNTVKLRQNRKTGAGKRDKQKKRSSLFEEVIVIDSSPEVISLSEEDTTDDQDGVCAAKGQRLTRATQVRR